MAHKLNSKITFHRDGDAQRGRIEIRPTRYTGRHFSESDIDRFVEQGMPPQWRDQFEKVEEAEEEAPRPGAHARRTRHVNNIDD